MGTTRPVDPIPRHIMEHLKNNGPFEFGEVFWHFAPMYTTKEFYAAWGMLAGEEYILRRSDGKWHLNAVKES